MVDEFEVVEVGLRPHGPVGQHEVVGHVERPVAEQTSSYVLEYLSITFCVVVIIYTIDESIFVANFVQRTIHIWHFIQPPTHRVGER